MARTLAVALAIVASATAAGAQQPTWSTEHVEESLRPELDAITTRGRILAEYDQAAWHGTDAVMALQPDRSRIGGYLAHRFPALAGSGLLHARVMPYEMTPDGHFLAAASERWERHWLLGGGSGHGFKHAPTLGAHVAELLAGETKPLATFAAGTRGAP